MTDPTYLKTKHGFDMGLINKQPDISHEFELTWVALKDYEDLKQKNEKLVDALRDATKSGDFFRGHADCTRDSFSCNCSFCKNYTDMNLKLNAAIRLVKDIGK